MGGLVDWAKWMVKDRRSISDPRSFKKDINPVKNLERRGEELDRLFVGAPDKPIEPEAAAPTLKAAESRMGPQEQQKKRRRASILADEKLSSRSILG